MCKSEASATRKGKADNYSKAVGSFLVVKHSDGDYGYWPSGLTPCIDGEPDRKAAYVDRWFWDGWRWSSECVRQRKAAEARGEY